MISISTEVYRSNPKASVQSPSRINVAYVVNSFAMGGLERCIARLINGLDRERFATSLVTLCNDTSSAGWLNEGAAPIVTLNKAAGNDLSVVWRLRDALRRLSIDIVHSHNWGTLVETTLARKWAGVPIHAHAERGTVGGSVVGIGLRQRLRGWAMRWCMRSAQAVVSNAVSVAKRVESRCGFPANRVRVIPNGVESLQLAQPEIARLEIRSQLNIADDVVVFGSVGRLSSVKAFELALQALAKVADVGPSKAHLLLVGDGPEYESLQRLAVELGIQSRVSLVGRRDDVGRWLAAMDVYLNTSLSEGMSQSIVEAMSTGLPLLVTDVGENAVLVEGPPQCGLVIPSGATSQLASSMIRLLSDAVLRTELGRNALECFRERYQLERMIADYQEFYCELLAGKRHKTAGKDLCRRR